MAIYIAKLISGGGGSGTVTSVSVVSANGVSGTVATATTTPAITIILGAIIPISVAASGTVTGSNLSGTNTGNVTLAGENYLSIAGQIITANAINLSGSNVTGILAAARFPALTGDVTTAAGSVATIISNNVISNAKLRQGIARSVIGVAGNATANVADIQGASDQILRVNSAGNILAFGAINLAASAAVTGFLPIANIVSASGSPGTQFLRGDGSWQEPSGAVTNVTGTSPIASTGGSTPDISISGVPVIVASNNATGQTAATSNFINYDGSGTPPAGTYRIGGYITINSISVIVLTFEVTYADQNGTGVTYSVRNIAGGSLNVTGTYLFPSFNIRISSGRNITINITTTGIGSVDFDAGATLEFLTS